MCMGLLCQLETDELSPEVERTSLISSRLVNKETKAIPGANMTHLQAHRMCCCTAMIQEEQVCRDSSFRIIVGRRWGQGRYWAVLLGKMSACFRFRI